MHILFTLIITFICTVPVLNNYINELFFYRSSILLCFLCIFTGLFVRKRKSRFFYTAILFIVFCFSIYKSSQERVFIGTDKKTVSLDGHLVRDSSYSKHNKLIMSVCIHQITDVYQNTASAKGVITAISDTKGLICAGSDVHLEGCFSENIFICTSLQVTKKQMFSFLRSNLILILRKQMKNCSLGEMLLLGKLDTQENITLRDLAKSCGCLHVLSLSGMHLNIIGSIIYAILIKLTKRKTISRIISLIFVLFFVFIAGPIPSLVRSAVMYFFFFLPPLEKIFVSFTFQLIFFPHTVFTQSSVYGYLSIIGILIVSPLITNTLENFLPKRIAVVFGTSVSVLLLNAPLQIVLSGVWHPVAIVAGPFASVLITFQMIIVLFSLLFPELLTAISEKNSFLLERLFKKSSQMKNAKINEYFYFVILFTILIFICILLNNKKKKDRNTSDNSIVKIDM